MRKFSDKRPTIADVAREANVSTATVSRALQNPELVSETTRKLVFAVVAKTGYRANTAAKMLRQNRSGTLLVVLPDIANPFFSEIMSGIEDTATEHSHTILIGNTNGDESRARDLLGNLRNGRADGALLLNGSLPLRAEEIKSLPLVSISEKIPDADISHVGTDSVSATFDATQHLIDQGHMRIGHYSGPEGNILTAERRKGYEAAMTSAGLERNIQIFPCGFTVESGQTTAVDMMAEGKCPTGLVCASDEAAMGAISSFREHGRSVPEDISVVGFDDILFAGIFSPPLTTIRQNRKEIGQRATEMLLNLIQGTAPQTETIVVPHSLIERDSAGAYTGRRP